MIAEDTEEKNKTHQRCYGVIDGWQFIGSVMGLHQQLLKAWIDVRGRMVFVQQESDEAKGGC